jgi:hypothetical protein
VTARPRSRRRRDHLGPDAARVGCHCPTVHPGRVAVPGNAAAAVGL